jgi:CDP-diacylglycerol--serine O-phosphatidyltransferase
MIGFYDYTVILTYFSLLSATTGIVVSLSGNGHPYYGCLFLLFCGLCDAFDGKVARTKKGRTRMEMDFGIQIDSLSDLVAFGVLPACIGAALIRVSPYLTRVLDGTPVRWEIASGKFVLHACLVLYVLAAMIRLAYYNVTEEERQKTETSARKEYLGLPVTSAALIFPFVLLLQYLTKKDITLIYLAVSILTGILFLSPVRIAKPGLRGILIMVGIGAVEFFLMLFWKVILK